MPLMTLQLTCERGKGRGRLIRMVSRLGITAAHEHWDGFWMTLYDIRASIDQSAPTYPATHQSHLSNRQAAVVHTDQDIPTLLEIVLAQTVRFSTSSADEEQDVESTCLMPTCPAKPSGQRQARHSIP